MKFEGKHEKLAPTWVLVRRLARCLAFAGLLAGVALLIGIAGYHWICGLSWIDSLLNASMILGGMGPVNPLTTDAAKIFASLYALLSGLTLIAVMGVLLAPAAHRLLHLFHVDEKDVAKR